MGKISVGKLIAVVIVAFLASFASVFADGVRTSEAKDVVELTQMFTLYGSKALAAGISASMSALVAYLMIPFKVPVE
jgi:hypothetical protein